MENSELIPVVVKMKSQISGEKTTYLREPTIPVVGEVKAVLHFSLPLAPQLQATAERSSFSTPYSPVSSVSSAKSERGGKNSEFFRKFFRENIPIFWEV